MSTPLVQGAKIAIVYAMRGGMGDVGKFAAMHAICDQGITPTIIALDSEEADGPEIALHVDVGSEEQRHQVKKALSEVDIIRLNVTAPETQAALASAFRGVDAVLACVGHRQPRIAQTLFGLEGYPTAWCTQGATVVLRAMGDANVHRLVLLSSFGIGKDSIRCGGMSVSSSCLDSSWMRA